MMIEHWFECSECSICPMIDCTAGHWVEIRLTRSGAMNQHPAERARWSEWFDVRKSISWCAVSVILAYNQLIADYTVKSTRTARLLRCAMRRKLIQQQQSTRVQFIPVRFVRRVVDDQSINIEYRTNDSDSVEVVENWINWLLRFAGFMSYAVGTDFKFGRFLKRKLSRAFTGRLLRRRLPKTLSPQSEQAKSREKFAVYFSPPL